MNPNIKLMEFLEVSRSVTDNYITAWGRWTLKDQWKKIKEEDKEFKNPTSNENELDEFWDCFFARLTLLHLEHYSDEEIFKAGIKCWNKIHTKSINKLTESRKCN